MRARASFAADFESCSTELGPDRLLAVPLRADVHNELGKEAL
jgi:hypothetical protein